MKALVIDFETNDPYIGRKLGTGYPFAINYPELADFYPIGFAYQEVELINNQFKPLDHKEYVPLSTKSLKDARVSEGCKFLKELIKKHTVIIAHNGSYEYGCIMSLEIDISHLLLLDTMLAAKLHHNLLWDYSLESLSEQYLSIKKNNMILVNAVKDLKLIKTKKGNPIKTDTRSFVARAKKWAKSNMAVIQDADLNTMALYAIGDIDCALGLINYYKRKLNTKEWKLLEFFGKITKICTKIRPKGIDIDLEALANVKEVLDNNILELSVYLSNALSLSPDRLNSNKAAAEAFEALGYTLKVSKAGNLEVNKKSMAVHAKNEVVEKFLEFKSLGVLKRSFIDKILAMQVYTCPIPAKYGKVFPELNPLRADTGRFSSTNPNSQNIPQRDSKYGNLIRSLFVPKEGKKWIKADWSNQEGRLQIHDAIRFNMPSALDWQTRFYENPDLDIHKITAEMMFKVKAPDKDDPEYNIWKKKYRDRSKTIYLGKSFCMGKASCAESLGLPTEYQTYISRSGKKRSFKTSGPEATKLIDAFDNAFPFLNLLQKKCSEFIEKNGYITTLLGRKCRQPMEQNGRNFNYKAISYRIQGSAADQMYLALEAADDAGLDILCVVHDEFCIQGGEKDAAKLKDIMEHIVELNIPSLAEIKIGESWGG